MKEQDVFNKVQEIVVAQLGVEPSQVLKDSSFANDLGADSLDIVELVKALEESFDIEIPDEEAEKIETVGSAVTHIFAKVSDKA